jgi:hypothetical protein
VIDIISHFLIIGFCNVSITFNTNDLIKNDFLIISGIGWFFHPTIIKSSNIITLPDLVDEALHVVKFVVKINGLDAGVKASEDTEKLCEDVTDGAAVEYSCLRKKLLTWFEKLLVQRLDQQTKRNWA